MRRSVLSSLALLPLAAGVLAAQPANSQNDFSGVQGQDGWFYGYWDRTTDANGVYDPSEFVQMTSFAGGMWSVSPGLASFWTFLSPTSAHGNGTTTSSGRTANEQWAIRRFVTTVGGVLSIGGSYGKEACGGDGTAAMILVDGASILSRTVGGCEGPTGYLVNAGYHAPGSVIDFVLTPGAASNDISDSSILTANITVSAVPEPASVALLAGGLVVLGALGRRRRAA